ncbi:hypothetical protein BDN67DRAFT_986235, partial [Paxillus ammoniavirescens]
HESSDSINHERECTATPLHRPNLFNIYGSDLTVADVLGDEEALEDEVLDEFMHRFDKQDDDGADGAQEFMSGGGATLLPPPATGSGSRTRATMSMWFAGEYQHLRECLAAEMKKSLAGLLQCYQWNMFCDGVENQYLAVRSMFQLSASLFHQPQFFVWFPHVLIDKIPCPACHDASRQPVKSSCIYLQKCGFADYPRRVVDVDRNVYIIGYQYACGHKDYGKPFLSWSPSILNCQFLEMVLHWSGSGTLLSLWTMVAPFGAFSDRNGYAGFILSARYFAKFYNMLVEESAPAMRQLIASLPADIIKQDHSFKAIKRLGKIEGVPTFNALFTTVNEYGEICSMNFTPSKGQDDWAPVLEAMLPSLKSFGHGSPKLVFTHNIRADKDCLLSIFPSLSTGVTPIPAVNDMSPLTLPSDWSSVLLTLTHQVNLHFNTIMNCHTDVNPVVVGLSVQWPLDVMQDITGHVSLIQVAYEDVVYLIQTKPFMQDGHLSLPHCLLTFLQSNAYHKVDVNITANLEHLRKDLIPSSWLTPFAGQLEISQIVYEHCAALQATVGLSTLCRSILQHQIDWNPMICISPTWANMNLPSEFITHATSVTPFLRPIRCKIFL